MLALTIRAVSLKQIVKAAVEAFAPMARQKEIHEGVQPGLSEAEMDGDPTRLQNCFRKEFRKQSIRLINRAKGEKKVGIYPM